MNLHLRTIKGLVKKEFIQIFRDKKMIAALFFLPLVQLTMFGLALTSEVKNIKLGIVSKPSALTRELKTRALASKWFKDVISIDSQNIENPADLVLSHQVEAVLVAPTKGLNYALERGNEPLQLIVNATNAQRAQQVASYVQQLLVRVANNHGYLKQNSLIELDARVLFNHYLNTTNFMVPALLVMSSFIVLMIVCCMSIAKEKETGTLEKLIASPASVADILLGKTIPYFILGCLIITAMLCVGHFGFNISLQGFIWQLALNSFGLIINALAIATLLSTVAHTQQQSMMGGVLILLPSILLAGIFFPVANIPKVFRWMCYLNPPTYAAANFRNIILKGGDMEQFFLYVSIMFVMGLVLSFFAYKNFKAKLN